MWQTKNAAQYKSLERLGFTAALVQADRLGETASSVTRKVTPIVRAGLRPYVENIATDFYSAYHRWAPDKPVNAKFLELQTIIAASPEKKAAFIRHPSLSDPSALFAIKRRIKKIVHLYAPYRPLFFNLGDEMGIADLSAAWDFDFSADSLSAMRRWLKGQYKTIAALNDEWGANFRTWQDVVPPTTTEAMMRDDENFAAWSDFKAWMNVAFAKAITAGSRAVHAGAPWALSGMEGAQMPGWGGYDYSRIASSVDVMELYDAGQSLELAQAFNPHLLTLTTLDWGQSNALYRAWHEFLRGARGMITWDANGRFVRPDGALGPDGRAAVPFLSQVQRPPATLIMASQPIHSPIAVLYSPQSYRLQWLLDHRAMGASWARLTSEDQNADNRVRAARRHVLELLNSFGLRPDFIDDEQISAGWLQKVRYKMVILPNVLALSSEVANALRAFVSKGGTLIVQGETGIFDGHGRRLDRPVFATLVDGSNWRALKLSSEHGEEALQLAKAFEAAGIVPEMQIVSAENDNSAAVEHYLYRKGPIIVAALLGKPGNPSKGGEANITLQHPAYIYDVREERFLIRASRFSVTVKESIPTILAISSKPLSSKSCKRILHWRTCKFLQ